MRALGVRSCRVTRALTLVSLGYGSVALAAEPAPPASAPGPAATAATSAPAAPSSAAPGAAPAQPWTPTQEPNPYPPPPPYYQPPPQGYPPGYYAQPYGTPVRVESLPRSAGSDSRKPEAVKPARQGFQLALRTGLTAPMGDATGAGNDSLSRRYSWQFPLAADLGFKVTEAVFVGGYAGIGFGGLGSDGIADRFCDDDDFDSSDVDCSSFTFQVGAQVHYSLDPGARWNPWIGYGIGYESARQSIVHDGRRYSESNTASGLTAAKLMFGADHRSTVGIGPFVEVAIGRYLRTSTQLNDDSVHSGAISNQAFHAWLTFGVRLVVMP